MSVWKEKCRGGVSREVTIVGCGQLHCACFRLKLLAGQESPFVGYWMG